MAIRRKTYKGKYTDTNEVFVCDAAADLSLLPTDAPQGSSAFVIEDSSTYMIDSSGQWTAVTIGGTPGDITLKTLPVDMNGTFTAPSGTAYNKVIASVAGRSAGTPSVVYDTLENVAVASVPDMDGGKELEDLIIGIEPVQDLNGNDAPWPSGGGKNKAEFWQAGYIRAQGDIVSSSTNALCHKIFLSNGQTVVMSTAGTNKGFAVFSDAGLTDMISRTGSGATSYTATMDCYFVGWFVLPDQTTASQSTMDTNKCQIEFGSTVTSYAPYTNICPITGWTGANIHVSPTSDLEDGRTYSVAFPSEAGTVYGGTLDVTNGILTVDRIKLSFLATGKQGNFFYTTFSAQSAPGIAGLNSGVICDRFPVVANVAESRKTAGIAAYPTNIIRWVDPLYIGNTWQEYNAAMGDERVTIVYKPAEPQIYQLTPTQVEALSGANNIWADCGNVISVVYQADPDTYADKHLPNDTAAAAADGKTHIWIRIDDDTPSDRMSVPLYWSQSVTRGVSVNWGDGTSNQTYDGTGADTHTHTYARPGDYEITLNVTDGTISFDGTGTTSGFSIYGSRSTASSYNRARILCAVIGKGVTKVGNYMFENAYSVKYVTIPSGVTAIGTEAFNRCHSLTDVYIPNGVTSIGASAFYYCYAMESVRIPNSVSSIGDEAFNNCFALKSVRLPDSLTSIGQSVFHGCYSLTSVEIPHGVLVIGSSAFSGCYGLTSVTIPASVISIGSGAFSNCYGVSEYHMRSQTPPTLTSSDVFGNIASDCVIYVPYSSDHSVLNAYKAATNWSVYAGKMQEEAQA